MKPWVQKLGRGVGFVFDLIPPLRAWRQKREAGRAIEAEVAGDGGGHPVLPLEAERERIRKAREAGR